LATSVLSKASIPSGKIIGTVDSVIADVAKKSGLEMPSLRPEELATDTGLVVDVIGHALLQLKTDYDESFSHAALVQATIPTVLPEDIDAAIRLVVDGDPNPIITGFPTGQRHPSTMYSLKSENGVRWLFEDKQRMDRRQDLPSVYVRTRLVYIIPTELVNHFMICLDRQKAFLTLIPGCVNNVMRRFFVWGTRNENSLQKCINNEK